MSTNQRILVIGDIHAPYQHRDTLHFLSKLKERYKPTRVVQIGDEVDGHRWSMHVPQVNAMGATEEVSAAKSFLQELAQLFPVMDIIESNHGSLKYRKAHQHQIPLEFIKSYQDVWGTPDGWQWHYELVLDLPNGLKCTFHHSRGANTLLNSQRMGTCLVQGHHHEKLGVQYWASPYGMQWAVQTGCLADETSVAMSYGKNNVKKHCMGAVMIINGYPLVVPMILDQQRRWLEGAL